MKRPNALQRLIHRFVMLKPVTAFFAPRTHVIDNFFLRITNGRHTLSETLGWNIIQLFTVGAKSGKPYAAILIGLVHGENIALIASNFGREHNPGWYHNLKKNPDCEVRMGGVSRKYTAREVEGEEREACWKLAVSYYQGYEKYRQRAAPRRIPIILLEPVKELPS